MVAEGCDATIGTAQQRGRLIQDQFAKIRVFPWSKVQASPPLTVGALFALGPPKNRIVAGCWNREAKRAKRCGVIKQNQIISTKIHDANIA